MSRRRGAATRPAPTRRRPRTHPRPFRLIRLALLATVCCSACENPTFADLPRTYVLDGARGPFEFADGPGTAGVTGGRFTLQAGGDCSRLLTGRAWTTRSDSLVLEDYESTVSCRWRPRGDRLLEINWEGGTPVGVDVHLVSPDSAVVHGDRMDLFIDTGLECFQAPCPTRWVEEYLRR